MLREGSLGYKKWAMVMVGIDSLSVQKNEILERMPEKLSSK